MGCCCCCCCLLAPDRTSCAIIDLIQYYARPCHSFVFHFRSHPVLSSSLTEPCVPSSISFRFTLAAGTGLCVIIDLIPFYARPWHSIVCHYRSHSVLRSPLAEHFVPLLISFRFTLSPGTAFYAIVDLIQFYARPRQSIVCH